MRPLATMTMTWWVLMFVRGHGMALHGMVLEYSHMAMGDGRGKRARNSEEGGLVSGLESILVSKPPAWF